MSTYLVLLFLTFNSTTFLEKKEELVVSMGFIRKGRGDKRRKRGREENAAAAGEGEEKEEGGKRERERGNVHVRVL